MTPSHNATTPYSTWRRPRLRHMPSVRRSVHTLMSIMSNVSMTMSEEQKFEELMTLLAMSGEFQESELEYHVHEIMDNPQYYPEYF